MSELRRLVEEAKTAYRAGQVSEAQQKLRQAVRLQPRNPKLWVALSKMASSSEESLAILKRAQRILPDEPLIETALQKHEPPVQIARWPLFGKRPFILPTITITLLLCLTLVGFLWAQQQNRQPLAPAQTELVIIPDIESPPPPEATTATPAATATKRPLDSKQLVVQDAPRATWTITPTPSPTPTPTPTVIPTFISYNYTQAIRPFGVSNTERWIDVNLSTQSLKAYEGDKLVFSTFISSGTHEYATVTGQFRIWLRFESQTMDGRRLGYDYYLENVPYVMYFFEDYAIHGAYWHNNFGQPMSHGCVNMSPDDAKWLYYWASYGTLVNVHY